MNTPANTRSAGDERQTGGVLLLNTHAGSMTPELEQQLRDVAANEGLSTRTPGSASDMDREVRECVRQRVPLVVAGGGDGTLHDVAQALLSEAAERGLPCPTLGVAPLGTGNDLARTLGLDLDPVVGLQETLARTVRTLDVLRVMVANETRYAVNVAAGGFAGLVDEELDDDTKRRFGALAYVTAGVAALGKIEPREVTFELDGQVFTERVVNIVVANARSCAGGTLVAPAADPEDGLFDLVLVTEGSLLELAGVAAALRMGTVLSSERTEHRVGRMLVLHDAEGLVFNLDGELLSCTPSSFEVLPHALPVCVGPAYKRERWTLPPD